MDLSIRSGKGRRMDYSIPIGRNYKTIDALLMAAGEAYRNACLAGSPTFAKQSVENVERSEAKRSVGNVERSEAKQSEVEGSSED